MRTGIDLVREQIRVAAGHPLSVSQADVRSTGHAIECRINAEDPSQNFRPSPGIIREWALPAGVGDGRPRRHPRRAGYEVPPYYDSLICKVIACGHDRDAAADQMALALAQLRCEGVATTIPMHLADPRQPEFRERRLRHARDPRLAAAPAH